MMCKQIVEKTYNKTPQGFWQEYIIYSIVFAKSDSSYSVVDKKIDRIEKGTLYREAMAYERSGNGEVVLKCDDGIERRLVGIANNLNGPMFG